VGLKGGKRKTRQRTRFCLMAFKFCLYELRAAKKIHKFRYEFEGSCSEWITCQITLPKLMRIIKD
jgi:hypothetical protein